MALGDARLCGPVLGLSAVAFLFASPALAATGGSSGVNGILLGIAVTLVGLICISIWLFRRSERQGAQARLRGEALDALPQAILVANAAGETLQVNSAWRGRVPGREENALDALEEAVSHDEAGRKAFSRLRASALASGVADAEIPVRQSNGQNWWCRISVRPMPQTEGAAQWSLDDSPARNALDQAVAAEQNRLV